MRSVLAVLMLVCITVVPLAAGCRTEPPQPANPELVAVYPAPESTLAVLDRVTLEFSSPIKDCRIGGLMRGTLPPPTISGSTLTWEIGASAPTGRWTVAVVGDVSFDGALTLHLQKSWGFDLAASQEPAVVIGGCPASTAIRSGSERSYVATVMDQSILRDTPSPEGETVWEGPPGVLFEVIDQTGGYVRVRPPVPDTSPCFSGGSATFSSPPAEGGYAELDAVWFVPPPWLPDAAETIVFGEGQRPRLAITLPSTAETTCQFTVRADSIPAPEAVDAAVAYTLFSRLYQTVFHVPAPSSDEVSMAPSPADLDFLVEEARIDIGAELSYVSSVPWPADLAGLRDGFLEFGTMCQDASTSVIHMMDPSQAADCRASLTEIIEAGGLRAPGPDAQIYEWGETAQSALNRVAEGLRAKMREMLAPGLSLWEPNIGD